MKVFTKTSKHLTQAMNKISSLALFALVLTILTSLILIGNAGAKNEDGNVGKINANSKTKTPTAQYDFYTTPDQTSYVALGIRTKPSPSNATHEVVFLVDTSASQSGQSRIDTIDTLKSAINNLPENSNVQILAMDVSTTALTSSFAPKNSKELADALKKLQRRVPLGATDLQKGIETARNTFDQNNDNTTKRAVVYLGDGRSMAQGVAAPAFASEVKKYNQQKIPFTACTTSPNPNIDVIAAFANQTGGNLVNFAANVKNAFDEARKTANDKKLSSVEVKDPSTATGKQLSDSITATVVWVDPLSYSFSFPDSWEVFPVNLQPIRSDRETIVFAKTDAADLKTFNLNLKGETINGEVELSWQITPNKNQLLPDGKVIKNGKQFLVGLVEGVARDGGLSIPIIDRTMLNAMQDAFVENIEIQLDKAKASIETGNPKQAAPILANVLKLDPGNKTAVRYLEVARLDGTNGAVDLDGGTNTQVTSNGNVAANEPVRINLPTMVDTSIKERSIADQKVQSEVGVVINNASKTMTVDPVGTEENIRLMITSVRENTTLTPNHRNILLDRLGNVLRQTQNEKYYNEIRDARNQVNQYVTQLSVESLNEIAESDARAIQIFNRFNALMNSDEYRTATTVAETAMKLLPEATAPATAHRLAMMTSYIMEYNELRHKRHVGFIESYMVLERSFIPIPEEPPITYIDPEQWLILKERRQKRYEVSDLKTVSPAEQRLRDALDKSIDITVGTSDSDNTLTALIEQIKAQTDDRINIRIDQKLIESGTVTSGTVIATEPVSYQGVKCRNVLKSLLSGISATDVAYCIDNEVLLITDAENAKKKMSSKVYPVGDIAVSPEPIGGGMGMGMMGGMGMGMMGGMGGMGGYGGGMMGGMGGYGGGMMGGMGGYGGGMGGYGGGMGGYGGGYGGGYMSVPVENIKRTNNTNSKTSIQNPISAVKNPVAKNLVAQKSVAQNRSEDFQRGNVNRKPATPVRDNKLLPASSDKTKQPRVVTDKGWSGGTVASLPIAIPKRGKEVVDKAMAASDVDAFWESFFSKDNIDENYIRDIVEVLKMDFAPKVPKEKRKKAATQLISLIESSILADKVYPWMYEVLALSLYVSDAPKAELERAVLSAADFCNDVEDLMNVAMFMQSIGLQDRAFSLFWQALESKSTPQFEYYAAAFKMAESLYLRDPKSLSEQQIKASEGAMCMASLAIISMEWDGPEGEKLIQRANDTIDLLVSKMKKEDRFNDAEMLTNSANEARLRDCMVTVEWTGNAGVSISVIEPTGSCCWFLNPRTLAGGMLKSNQFGNGETLTERSGKRRVSYVCPRGFNGTYQVVVHRDWGKLVNGMVNVKVDTAVISCQSPSDDTNKLNVNSLKAQILEQGDNIDVGAVGADVVSDKGIFRAYPIRDGGSGIVVTFDLNEGRRLEKIDQAKLNIAEIRASVARKTLAQLNVLRRLKNDSVLAQVVANTGGGSSISDNPDLAAVSLIRNSGNRSNNGAAGRASYIPFFGQSVIGYQPTITWLQEGTQLMSNAVISADRCYVRLSPSPMFSDIREVFKYNMAGGSETSTSTNGSSGYGSSGYGNSGYGSSGYGNSGYGNTGYGSSGYGNTGYGGGYGSSGYGNSGYGGGGYY